MSERSRALAGLFCVVFATLLLEVLLTRFFALKLAYHHSFVMISLALLGSGVGALVVPLARDRFLPGGRCDGALLAAYAWCVSASAMAGILAFCSFRLGATSAALTFYTLLVAPPFVLSGVVVASVLAGSTAAAGAVYAVDLFAAALGAGLAPFLLETLGGYGALAVAAWSAFLGAAFFGARSIRRGRALGALFVVTGLTAVLLAYPGWARRVYGWDVHLASDTIPAIASRDFGGVEQIYWNPLGRVHVTHVGDSREFFYRYGLSPRWSSTPVPGRLIFADQVIVLRQFLLTQPPELVEYLGDFVWSAPYLLHPHSEKALIIGAGGGIDILVAKHFKVRDIVAVEVNSDTRALLIGRPEDPRRSDFAKWYASDATSQVSVLLAEGRHFSSTQPPGSYDFVVSNATDTHSLVHGGSYNLSENFLYTVEALAGYYRLLRPGGYVGVSYWDDPRYALRLFGTMTAALEAEGVTAPEQQLVALVGGGYYSMLVKKGALTAEEIAELEAWAQQNGFAVLYHPRMTLQYGDRGNQLAALRSAFAVLARGSPTERASWLDQLPHDLSPTTDDRPFFYLVERHDQRGVLGFLAGIVPIPGLWWIIAPLLVLNLAVMFAPVWLARRAAGAAAALPAPPRSLLRSSAYFSLCGFGFILTELGALVILSVFVGGPFYALVVLLPSIFAGYALGSFLTARLLPFRLRSWWLLVAGAAVLALCGLLLRYSGLPPAALPHPLRVAVAVALCGVVGVFVGCPTPWLMETVRQRDPGVVPWMWAASSGWNVVGGLLHVSVILLWGTSSVFVLAGLCYLAALLIARSEVPAGDAAIA